ncbi:MAG: ATP-binding cassette domain-containing protein [Endomicrobium sp.]|nr:ATP-binding cassette domain-containing protein [Endomicrobium sp.]
MVGYENKTVLVNINLSVTGAEHLAVTGDNGSGKTTLFRAILGHSQITKAGIWSLPHPEDIGYLDQHYSSLDPSKTILEMLTGLVPEKTHAEVRNFLNDFLFRKNEEVNKQISVLSGGEQARLALAKIALQPPKLLLIDEITNNIDLETKEHVAQVLTNYPGAMIIISHDTVFLENIGITRYYTI